MALLAHKGQSVVGTILLARVATRGAALAGVVRIHTDAPTACQGGFVGQQSTEFGKGPTGGMSICLAGLGGNWDKLFALAAPRASLPSLADAREVFQANQAVGMGIQDVLDDRVIGAQLEPSRLPGR